MYYSLNPYILESPKKIENRKRRLLGRTTKLRYLPTKIVTVVYMSEVRINVSVFDTSLFQRSSDLIKELLYLFYRRP